MRPLFVTMLISVGLLLSCTASDLADQAAEETLVRFSAVSDPETRAPGALQSQETAVNDIQVLVFRPDGSLDGAVAAAGAYAELKCTVGPRHAVVLVNAPDMSGITSLSALRSQVVDLSDNAPGHLMMSGEADVEVVQGASFAVNVSRICAKVQIVDIVKSFSSAAMQGKTLEIGRIYMTNVMGSVRMGDLSAAGTWYNMMRESGSCRGLLYDEVNAVADPSFRCNRVYYVLPNDLGEGPRGGVWSPRPTRMVIEASVDGRRCYYVLDMPRIERNTAYVIDRLVITRMGSEDEESQAETGTLILGFEVLPWVNTWNYGESI